MTGRRGTMVIHMATKPRSLVLIEKTDQTLLGQDQESDL